MSGAEVEWSNEAVQELVEAYRARAELWDHAHELHAVHTAKYEAWSTLARRFRCDIADLRKKMTSVLASYRREKGKVRAGGRSSWFLYPRLHFLRGYLPSPPAPAPAPPSPSQHKTGTLQAEKKRKTNRLRFQTRRSPPRTPSPPLDSTPPASPAGGRARVRRPRRAGGGGAAQLLCAVRRLRTELARRDECASFGQYIAVALRKHDARAQACIKQAINNILFEQEMNKCSAAPRAPPHNPLADCPP